MEKYLKAYLLYLGIPYLENSIFIYMTERDYKIARELKEAISRITPLVDFRVFGSRARGDAEEDSDMDVFVEVESLDRTLNEKIRHTAWEVGFNNYMVISVSVFSREEIEESPLQASHLVLNIMEEGISL